MSTFHELRETAKRTFGKKLGDDDQKYFYYDSDEDRIDISDDEELEEAMEHCKKTCLKIHIENYDVQKDPFFLSQVVYPSERDTGPSTEPKEVDHKFSDLVSSAKSNFESLNSSVDHREAPAEEELKRAFNSIEETVS